MLPPCLVIISSLLVMFGHAADAFCGNARIVSRKVYRIVPRASSNYEALEGEKRINLKIDLREAKVATMETLESGEQKVYCRCWLSGTFPACDGTHMKHNAACNDNVGPLIVKIPKQADQKASPEESQVSKSKVDGRRTRLLWGYRATAIAYFIYCQRCFAVIGMQPFALQLTSGYALAGGLSYILASAEKGERLASDTYKRLNLALLEFGLIGIIGWCLVRYGATAPGFTPLILPPVLAAVHGTKGYAYGVLGYDKSGKTTLVGDLTSGIASTIKGYFTVPQNATATGYLVATWMMTGMTLAKLVELFLLAFSGASGLILFTRLSRFARYAMVSTVLYTLKDAADRGRLEGTTFVELNFMSCAVLAALASFSGLATPLGTAAAFFSSFSAYNGVASVMKKRQSG